MLSSGSGTTTTPSSGGGGSSGGSSGGSNILAALSNNNNNNNGPSSKRSPPLVKISPLHLHSKGGSKGGLGRDEVSRSPRPTSQQSSGQVGFRPTGRWKFIFGRIPILGICMGTKSTKFL